MNIDALLASLEELPIAAHSSAIATAQAKFTERLLREQNGNGAHAVGGEDTDKLLTPKQAALRLGVSPDWLHDRELPFAVRLPGVPKNGNSERKQHVRYSAAGIERWIRSRSGR
jgi:hypothetical protein